MAIFSGGHGLADTRMSPFWILLQKGWWKWWWQLQLYKTCKAAIKSSLPRD